MTSMGPVLYSDVVYLGPEFGVILTNKFRALLRYGASKTSSVGMLEYPSPDQQRIEAPFLSTHLLEENPRPGTRDIYNSTPG